jgi:hypothetical protein
VVLPMVVIVVSPLYADLFASVHSLQSLHMPKTARCSISA